MSTDNVALNMESPRSSEPSSLRRWWCVITIALMIAVFIQAAFAGAMLSGLGWAHSAHAATAGLLMASSLIAGLVAIVTLRRIQHGRKLGFTLLALGALIVIQLATGGAAEHGTNIMWLHVPLGVALVGIATQAASAARRLDGE
jgi:hypothetical protein